MNVYSCIRRLYLSYTQKGRLYCPICDTTSKEFLTYGVTKRPHAMCPQCKSLERHRLLWLYLQQRSNVCTANLRMLDIAPQKFLQEKFKAMTNLSYLSIDLTSELAMEKMDLTHLLLDDDSFDFVLCYHVLEHIPDDRKAMREILRVMKPGGWGIIQSPVEMHRSETYEDFSVTSHQEREKHFGQWDHVRIYGRDYADRLQSEGFIVEQSTFARDLSPMTVRRCSVKKNEILYLCRKPA